MLSRDSQHDHSATSGSPSWLEIGAAWSIALAALVALLIVDLDIANVDHAAMVNAAPADAAQIVASRGAAPPAVECAIDTPTR